MSLGIDDLVKLAELARKDKRVLATQRGTVDKDLRRLLDVNQSLLVITSGDPFLEDLSQEMAAQNKQIEHALTAYNDDSSTRRT